MSETPSRFSNIINSQVADLQNQPSNPTTVVEDTDVSNDISTTPAEQEDSKVANPSEEGIVTRLVDKVKDLF